MSLSRLINQYLEMKLLCGLFLVYFCNLSSRSTSSSNTITHSHDVSVTEGENFTITCCWTESKKEYRLNWLKNITVVQSGSQYQISEGNFCSNLTFALITTESSGRYICSLIMEIPTLERCEGNGTVVTVLEKNDKSENNTGGSSPGPSGSSQREPVIISLSVFVLLTLIALICCFFFLQRRKALATRVIHEIPHIDSEEAEMDKNSTGSSTGSSQWCQVPVYESFDYFEGVQIKNSG